MVVITRHCSVCKMTLSDEEKPFYKAFYKATD